MSVRGPRLPAHGGDRGLTTLQWLLITALVAAVATGAILVLGTAVEEAGETVAGGGAQIAAARSIAGEVASDAMAARARDFDTWDDWESHFRHRCELVLARFGADTAAGSHNRFARAADGRPVFDETAAGHAAAADEDPPTPTKAQALCSPA